MTDMFVSLGTWNWLIFGFILMALEVLAPGVFLFWLGLAALLVGLISFAISHSWQMQLLMFAIFAAAAVPVWRRLARSDVEQEREHPFLNKRDRCAARPGVHAGETDRRRHRHGADRRHGLARRRSRYAGRHAGEGRAGGRCEPDGGGGVNQLAPRALHLSANRCSGRTFRTVIAQSGSARNRRRAAARRTRPRATRSAAPAAPSARPRRRPCAMRAR